MQKKGKDVGFGRAFDVSAAKKFCRLSWES